MMKAPVQVGMVGFLLIFATPLCCAFFPQIASFQAEKLEPEIIVKLDTQIDRLYFNKGL